MTDIITTTLAQIRRHSPCEDGYKKLCKSLGGVKAYGADTAITFRQIYESNGYDDTLWCLRTVDEKWSLFHQPDTEIHNPGCRHDAEDGRQPAEADVFVWLVQHRFLLLFRQQFLRNNCHAGIHPEQRTQIVEIANLRWC